MKWEYQIIKIVKQKEKADQIAKPQNKMQGKHPVMV
jgi:hypothetical protein